MVDTGKRSMKKKSRKTPSKTTMEYFKGINSKRICPITKTALLGVTHDQKKAKKQSKTQKRPNVPFGGVLSSKAREQVFTEVAKVRAGIKEVNDIDQKYRKYVKQAMKLSE
jgi:large subunit ribosomal protein L34e